MADGKKAKVGSEELVKASLVELRAWQRDRKAIRTCPYCGAEGLVIADRSARPFAEWYSFNCRACGLDDALHIPLAAHRPPG